MPGIKEAGERDVGVCMSERASERARERERERERERREREREERERAHAYDTHEHAKNCDLLHRALRREGRTHESKKVAFLLIAKDEGQQTDLVNPVAEKR